VFCSTAAALEFGEEAVEKKLRVELVFARESKLQKPTPPLLPAKCSYVLIWMPRAVCHDGDGRRCGQRLPVCRLQRSMQGEQQRLVTLRVVHNVSQQQHDGAAPPRNNFGRGCSAPRPLAGMKLNLLRVSGCLRHTSHVTRHMTKVEPVHCQEIACGN
jgi:hypothetical protein